VEGQKTRGETGADKRKEDPHLLSGGTVQSSPAPYHGTRGEEGARTLLWPRSDMKRSVQKKTKGGRKGCLGLALRTGGTGAKGFSKNKGASESRGGWSERKRRSRISLESRPGYRRKTSWELVSQEKKTLRGGIGGSPRKRSYARCRKRGTLNRAGGTEPYRTWPGGNYLDVRKLKERRGGATGRKAPSVDIRALRR